MLARLCILGALGLAGPAAAATYSDLCTEGQSGDVAGAAVTVSEAGRRPAVALQYGAGPLVGPVPASDAEHDRASGRLVFRANTPDGPALFSGTMTPAEIVGVIHLAKGAPSQLVRLPLGPAAPARPCAAVPPLLRALEPAPLSAGANRIPKMTDDGREGLIVAGERNYLTADGAHRVFMVVTRDRGSAGGWSVVTNGEAPAIGPDDPPLFEDTPHTGEDMVRSVRFARARLGGRPAFVALVAQRAFGETIPSPSRVEIRTYLLTTDADVGADVFVLVDARHTRACYGNADLALQKELGLPLPPGYEGPTAAEPCS